MRSRSEAASLVSRPSDGPVGGVVIAGVSLPLVWLVVQNISWFAVELTAQRIECREANGNDSAGLDAREVRFRKAYAFR